MTPIVEEFYKENLGDQWFKVLKPFLATQSMEDIRLSVLESRRKTNVFPEAVNMFKAYKLTPLDDVKVVIIGMDPYHTPGYASGVAFSSASDKHLPPSLKNILKEVESDYHNGLDLDVDIKHSLEHWCEQGVLLINTALTVEQGKPGSHSHIWKPFTKEVMKILSERTGLIYVLWGNHAKSLKPFIKEQFNHILESVHPSPLSAYGGFFGCKHFTKVNTIIEELYGEEYKIKW